LLILNQKMVKFTYMALDPNELQKKFLSLAPNKQQEVVDFIEFLESKKKMTNEKPSLSWIGALEKHKNDFTSLELQKKANEWRD